MPGYLFAGVNDCVSLCAGGLKLGAEWNLFKQFAYRLTTKYFRNRMDKFEGGDDSASDGSDN